MPNRLMSKDFIHTNCAVAVIAMTLLCGGSLAAQEEYGHDERLQRHQLTVFTGYTWIPAAEQETKSFVIAPTIGLDYGFRFSHSLRLGIMNDLELTSYVIETEDGSPLAREYAYVGTVVGVYEVARGLELFAGPGVELESNKNFFVVKVGVEFVFAEADNGWLTGITSAMDFKNEYNSVGLGVSVSRRFLTGVDLRTAPPKPIATARGCRLHHRRSPCVTRHSMNRRHVANWS